MASQQQARRARSSSDKAQGPPAVLPQRPSLQNRTISAPAGDLPLLDRPRAANVEKTMQATVVEENEAHLPSPSGDTVKHGHTAKGNDEVRSWGNDTFKGVHWCSVADRYLRAGRFLKTKSPTS